MSHTLSSVASELKASKQFIMSHRLLGYADGSLCDGVLPDDIMERILGKVNPLQRDPYWIRESCQKVKLIYDIKNPWRLLCITFFQSSHIPDDPTTRNCRQYFNSLMQRDLRNALPENKRYRLDADSNFSFMRGGCQHLDLSYCDFSSVPIQTWSIRMLRTLHLLGCSNLKSLEEEGHAPIITVHGSFDYMQLTECFSRC